MLTIKHLSKSFGDLKAVKDISFHVKKGTTIAFLGTNGAGKSTVIYMLIDLLKPDKGTITFKNKEVVGVVFQSHRLDEVLTIEENLIIRAKLHGMSRALAKQRINELLSLTGLSDKRHRKYGQCSGGEKRKTDIIRALVHNPSFLILDEPTIGLDANSRKEIWAILDILQKKHELTIFLTTHYIEEADYVDHVLVMHEGEIAVQGTPEELRERYSETLLKLEPKNKDCIRILTDLNYTLKLEHNSILVTIPTSKDAIRILELTQDYITGFSLTVASLEHAFLKITEQIKGKVKL